MVLHVLPSVLTRVVCRSTIDRTLVTRGRKRTLFVDRRIEVGLLCFGCFHAESHPKAARSLAQRPRKRMPQRLQPTQQLAGVKCKLTLYPWRPIIAARDHPSCVHVPCCCCCCCCCSQHTQPKVGLVSSPCLVMTSLSSSSCC